ncbi:DNA topoisomerase [Malassezia cuniculi]|uniref:DNA topoisomerase n=1 Tax=Malassezia cuniculi TaxID=948313 RepID=A0AAF0J764_9BASI|nr:DNA topoisomerase [Malassezia cuniculi]
MHNATSLFSASTELSADSIESHPALPFVFAESTYQVDKEDDGTPSPAYTRRGRCRIQKAEPGKDGIQFTTLDTHDTAAILDTKWTATSDHNGILAIADATGHVQLHRLTDTLKLEQLETLEINSEKALCLSLDWTSRTAVSASCVISQSNGTLARFSSIEKPVVETWSAHGYEAWICAWNQWNNNIIWSGADDLTLRGWDVRMPVVDDTREPIFSVTRGFNGGVTAIESNAHREHYWAVGSYDENLRLFDDRNPRRPVSTTSVGGGIWRAKWHPTRPGTLLLGCMHDGFKVLESSALSDGTDPTSMDIVTRFDAHESIAYGCDWERGTQSMADASSLLTASIAKSITQILSGGSFANCVTRVTQDAKQVAQNIAAEARKADMLMIWTDCDREGEHIGYEIAQHCRSVKPRIKVTRARFSSLIPSQIKQACVSPVDLDLAAVHSVEARQQIDLRVGAAFTRLQTGSLKHRIRELDGLLISYGPCQFPTLGFVVDHYKRVQSFVPEPFWYIEVKHKLSEGTVTFSWERNHLFDETIVKALHSRCRASREAQVVHAVRRPTSKRKPAPLTTVELQKSASRLFHLAPKHILDVAEKLYQQGLVSYPRTETDQYDKDFDFGALIEKQHNDPDWGSFARELTQGSFEQPRNGSKNDKAHPPIHPTAHANGLSGDEKRIYEYITRRFLASCSSDAIGSETNVSIELAEERFHASGLTVIHPNFLTVFIYDKWSDKWMPLYELGQRFRVSSCDFKKGSTTQPNLLTEADLVGLMDKHGIGTDATIAEHIRRVIDRQYVMTHKKAKTTYLVPSALGMGLADGYDAMELTKSLCKPHLRRETEEQLTKIASGELTSEFVVDESMREYSYVYSAVQERLNILAEYVAKNIRDGALRAAHVSEDGTEYPGGGDNDPDDAPGGDSAPPRKRARTHATRTSDLVTNTTTFNDDSPDSYISRASNAPMEPHLDTSNAYSPSAMVFAGDAAQGNINSFDYAGGGEYNMTHMDTVSSLYLQHGDGLPQGGGPGIEDVQKLGSHLDHSSHDPMQHMHNMMMQGRVTQYRDGKQHGPDDAAFPQRPGIPMYLDQSIPVAQPQVPPSYFIPSNEPKGPRAIPAASFTQMQSGMERNQQYPVESPLFTPASVFSTMSSSSTNDFFSPITSPALQPQPQVPRHRHLSSLDLDSMQRLPDLMLASPHSLSEDKVEALQGALANNDRPRRNRTTAAESRSSKSSSPAIGKSRPPSATGKSDTKQMPMQTAYNAVATNALAAQPLMSPYYPPQVMGMQQARTHQSILPGVLSTAERNAWLNACRSGSGVDQRRTSHKAAEQKRRDSLKHCFDELRSLLPGIALDDSIPGGSALGPDGTPEDQIAEGFDPMQLAKAAAEAGEDLPRADMVVLTPDQAREANKTISKVLLLRHSNEYLVRLKHRVNRRDKALQALSEEVTRLRNRLAEHGIPEEDKSEVQDSTNKPSAMEPPADSEVSSQSTEATTKSDSTDSGNTK